jgi:hypothetical protein
MLKENNTVILCIDINVLLFYEFERSLLRKNEVQC